MTTATVTMLTKMEASMTMTMASMTRTMTTTTKAAENKDDSPFLDASKPLHYRIRDPLLLCLKWHFCLIYIMQFQRIIHLFIMILVRYE